METSPTRTSKPLYCGFEALVKIEFYLVALCVWNALTSSRMWFSYSPPTVAIGNEPTHLPWFFGDRHVGPIGPRWRSPEPRPFARHRSPSNDQPSPATPWHAWCRRFCPGGVANCVQPTGEKRPLRFFCLKKLHEVNQVFLLRDEGVFTAWLIDMIMVTGCHRNNVSCDPLGKFALKMQTSRLLISPCERKKYLSGL